MPTLPAKPPEWIATAPTRLEESIDIDATPAEVWAHIEDHESWPEWMPGIDRVEVTSGTTDTDGGQVVKGGPFTFNEEFTAYDEASHLAWTVVETNMVLLAGWAESVRLEPLDAGARTRVVYRAGMEGRPLLGWLMVPIGKQAAKRIREGLDNLRGRAEAS